jgi:hypothetical protein
MGRGKHLLRKIQVPADGADEEPVKRVDPLRALRGCRARRDDEFGASLVEFALVLPVFLMLILGMMTGGLAYSRKLSVAQAAREGARFGATLPITATLPTDAWLTRVADLTEASSDGELAPTKPGQFTCVAYVPATGSPRKREESGGAFSFSNGACIAVDGRAGESRVQVVAQRRSTFEALLFSRSLVLDSHAVARFEAP